MTFCDAHIHIVPSAQREEKGDADALADLRALFAAGNGYCACSCAHDEAEFFAQQQLLAALVASADEASAVATSGARASGVRVVSAFGIHPQAPDLRRLPFLEALLVQGAIGAIGEAGFDMYTEAFAARVGEQEAAWRAQLELSARYGVPLVVHCRKAQERLFRDSALLKRLPAVIFHSFMGSVQDATSLLRRGVNGYFSFGKPLLNGKKSAIACVRALPFERLLLETDAPYQTLKGERATAPAEITRVYATAATLRGCSMEALSAQLAQNFAAAFATAAASL